MLRHLNVVVKAKPEEKLTMTAEATGVKKITVTFNKAVDTTTTTLVVKKGTATPTVASTTFAADAKSAEIVMGTKLTAGTYTVEATVGEEKLTADITVQDEKLTSFELVSPNLVATAKSTTTATISYKALNQYGEMMVANQPEVTCTFGKTKDHGTPTADKSATATIEDINTALAIPGTTGTIVIVDKSTGVNLNTSVTYQSKAIPSAATVYGIYSYKTEKLIEGNLSTGAKGADYAILINVKDQYGNDMSPAGIKGSEVAVSYNAAAILTDMELADKEVQGDEKELTYEGASAFLIPLKDAKINKAGSLSMTIVSANKGVIASPTFTVDEAKVIKTLSASPASTVYADEDNKIVVEAYDAAGNAITKYDDLNAAGLTAKSSVEQSADDELVLKKNADGTGTLYFNPDPFGSDAKNFKESNIATIIFTANSPTSSDYLVKTINVTYYEKRAPWAVSGKTDKTITAAAVSSTLKLDLTTLTYEDQYSNIVKATEGTAQAATKDVDIYLVDKDGVFGTVTNGKQLTTEIVGNNVTLTADTKGDATLYFRYKGAERLAAKADTDTGAASADKYDLKLTISGTSVSDTSASNLKLVVNKGNAIYASKDVEIAAFNDATTDVTQQNGFVAANEGTAYVYVTGVVNGKTVVLPSKQYTVITNKISGLGEYNAKDNAKTETKTITVVVDSESGAQTLTADVTVSNLPREITTLKEKSSSVTITGNVDTALKATKLIEAVKILDQYGNEITEDKSADFTYKVEMTGKVDSEKYSIVHPETQAIEVTFKAAADYNADVTITTKDGKISFTKSVTFKIS